jgi:hypothetical protein
MTDELRFPMPDGWHAELIPLTFGRARIIVTDGTFVRDGW